MDEINLESAVTEALEPRKIRQRFSHLYAPLFKSKARYILLWGGRGRGGSYTATQYFATLMLNASYFRGYLMREIHSDVRESLWRDLKDRLHESEVDDLFHLNDSAMNGLCIKTGNQIMTKGFKKSASNRTARLKSLAGATHVIIEEAEEVSEEDFLQLDDTLRSIKAPIQVILIFNPPPRNHWIWRRWFQLADIERRELDTMGVPKDLSFYRAIPRENPEMVTIFSTYYDNISNINPGTARTWEEYRDTNPEHYWTIVRGMVSEGKRGRIYKNWKRIPIMPNLYPKFYGLDWGFSGDPLALVEMEAHNRTLYVDQKIYASGLTNDDLHIRLTQLGISKSAPIYADSAQPKDIQDMRARFGWNFIAASKGQGSVNSSISYIKQFEVFMTERSSELWLENENYSWALDQHKNPLDTPIGKFNHGMDAISYGMDKLRVPAGVAIITGAGQRAGNGRTEYSM